MKRNILYKAFVLATIVGIWTYSFFHKADFAGYLPTLILFCIVSVSVVTIKRIDFRMLWLTLPASIFTVAFFFRTHAFPEIMIIAINRLFLSAGSVMPEHFKKINRFAKTIYINAIVFIFVFESLLNLAYFIYPFNVLKNRNAVFRLSPNTFINNSRVNEEGYMGKSIKDEKVKKRILFVGDSFGVGVVDYGNNFIQMINDSTDYECINLSQPGYSPVDYFRELKANLKESEAEVAIVVLFAGNDIMDLSTPENSWSINKWKITNMIKNASVIARRPGSNNNNVLNMTDVEFLRIERDRLLACNEEKLKSEWRKFNLIIEEIKELLDENGVKAIFILIPDQYSIDKELQRMLCRENDKGLAWKKPIEKIASVLISKGAEFVDVTPALEKSYENGVPTYRKNDTHINEAGNRVVFEEIRKHLDIEKK